VIMATDYCDQIIPLIDKMAKAGMIASSDLELVHATDSVDDAIAHIRSHAIEPFGLPAARRVRPHWRWLGEAGFTSASHRIEQFTAAWPAHLKIYTLTATLTDRNKWRTQDEQRNSCC
jgi:hypothetical protein